MRQKNRGVLDTPFAGYDESLGEVELGTSTRHCEEQSDEAIQLFGTMDCFAEPVLGRAVALPVDSQ